MTYADTSRFPHHRYRVGRQGGLNTYALSGLLGKLNFSIAPTATTLACILDADVEAIIDGQKVLYEDVTKALTPVGVTTTGFTKQKVYLTPPRLYKAQAAEPTLRADGTALQEGDVWIKTEAAGEVDVIVGFYKYVSGDFVAFDPTFEAPTLKGRDYGWGNEVLPTSPASADVPSLSLTPERTVYHKSGYPPYTSASSQATFRLSASPVIAEVDLYSVVLPISFSAATTDESTTVTVSAATAAIIRSISAGNAGSLPANLNITGTGIPVSTVVSSVHATLNTIVISNAATATAADVTLTIDHATIKVYNDTTRSTLVFPEVQVND